MVNPAAFAGHTARKKNWPVIGVEPILSSLDASDSPLSRKLPTVSSHGNCTRPHTFARTRVLRPRRTGHKSSIENHLWGDARNRRHLLIGQSVASLTFSERERKRL